MQPGVSDIAPWGKVAIGARLTRIDPAFFISWTALVTSGLRAGDRILNPAVGLPHCCAANFLCAEFLKTDCDALLFLDDDMVFTPDDVANIRDRPCEYDVVSALACCRRHPNYPVVLVGWSDGKPVKTLELDGGPVAAQFVGLAFTLVRRWVIERLARDHKHIFHFDPEKGEDGAFSERAIAAGAKLAVYPDVAVGHQIQLTARWDVIGKRPTYQAQQYGLS